MLKPSIDSLMTKINSKYTLVTISSQRARELRDYPETASMTVRSTSPNFVGRALEEIDQEILGYKKLTCLIQVKMKTKQSADAGCFLFYPVYLQNLLKRLNEAAGKPASTFEVNERIPLSIRMILLHDPPFMYNGR
ncbi:DNA-directed RNA polymerase, omega subunit [[Bacillus] selenitireducens MLS10]|uniref:DNA-directed RNA polymerase subunit omega n=1 Tax=Bacillus selenitireducens (strain ATCC 700615 / DSM 15326 / MLS10) TaxID=439292 RepID=D6XTR1_BACIE|nr:DNA-directed RNA polymerase, omega subunit [[Bacillus] selenitireducens MLS10]